MEIIWEYCAGSGRVYIEAHHGEQRFQNLSNAMIALTNDRNVFNTVIKVHYVNSI